MAQRGFFSFDCDMRAEAPAPYFSMAKPEKPLLLDELSDEERRLIGLIPLSQPIRDLQYMSVF